MKGPNLMYSKDRNLPTTLSEMIRLAVTDANRLDRQQYHADASFWHQKMAGGPCEVCVAGMVMAGTLESHLSEHFFTPMDNRLRCSRRCTGGNASRGCTCVLRYR